MSTLVHNYEGSHMGNAAPSAPTARGQQSGSTPVLFGRTGPAGLAPGHTHPVETDSSGYGRTGTVEGHSHQVERFEVMEAGEPPHSHPLQQSTLMPKGTMSGNEEQPMGMLREADFAPRPAANQGKPTFRPRGVLTVNDQGEQAMGILGMEEPCTNCPDAKPVANDEEQPLGTAWQHQ